MNIVSPVSIPSLIAAVLGAGIVVTMAGSAVVIGVRFVIRAMLIYLPGASLTPRQRAIAGGSGRRPGGTSTGSAAGGSHSSGSGGGGVSTTPGGGAVRG